MQRVSFFLQQNNFSVTLSDAVKTDPIYFKTVLSIIKKHTTTYQIEENMITGTTETSEQLIIDVEGFCKRQNLVFEPISTEVTTALKTHELGERSFAVCKEEASLARDNQLEKELAQFNDVIKQLLVRELRPYQTKAAFYASKATMSCNFSVPGSGKTTIAYALFAYLNALTQDHPAYVEKVLVIGPISSFQPWKEEFSLCFGDLREPNITVFNNHSPQEINAYCRSKLTSEITVVNFEKIRNNAESFQTFLKRNNVLLIVDEAHRMKNPLSQTSIAIRQLGTLPNAKLLLTGTPMPNGYEDLFTQFKFLWPNQDVIGFSYNRLKRLSQAPPGSLISQPQIETLQNNISPFFVRITKDMLALPHPEEPNIVKVKLSKNERELYELINRKRIEIDPSDLISIKLLRAKIIRLMQVSTNPRLLANPLHSININLLFGNASPGDDEIENTGNDLVTLDPLALITSNATKNHILNLVKKIGVSTKLQAAVQLIHDIVDQGNKVIVWTIFVQTIHDLEDLITTHLQKRVGLLYGGTRNIRAEIIDEFKTSDDLNIVIANPSAVSESISLHKSCHHAIYLDISYNATHFIQSKDRIHRLGLPEDTKTHYYFLQAEDTIDARVYSRVVMKEERMLGAIENSLPPILAEDSISDFMEDLRTS